MPAQSVLTVEDDAAIRRGIVDALRFAGYGVFEAARGDTGREMALAQSYDLLLLDLVLPGCDGLDILRAVRQLRPTQPVIILTARGEESDRVDGLRLGADDYVVKPFSVKELLARVEAVLRRSPERPQELSQLHLPGAIADLRAARFGSPTASAVSYRKKRWSCSVTWRPIRAGRFPARSCCVGCGKSILAGWPPARSTCTSLGCGKNCATILSGRRLC